MTRFARTFAALFASLALTSPGARAQIPLEAPRFVQAGDLGVDVTVRYQLRPALDAGADGDPGPYLGSGTVAITAGPARTRNVFTLDSLAALAPNLPQIVPAGASNGCGTSGPLAIEKLVNSAYPAVVVMTVIVVKGCLPLAHVFVPLDEASTRYHAVPRYAVAHRPRLFLGERYVPPRSTGSLKVASVRQIVLPSSPAGESFAIENWNIVILDGTAADGRPATIALDRPNADETPEVGETVSLFDVPGATGSVIRLSYGHEEGYQRLHPQPPSLPPGAR